MGHGPVAMAAKFHGLRYDISRSADDVDDIGSFENMASIPSVSGIRFQRFVVDREKFRMSRRAVCDWAFDADDRIDSLGFWNRCALDLRVRHAVRPRNTFY